MAFSALTDRGTLTEKTSDTSIGISPSAAIAVGKLAVLWAVTDNPTATDGATTDHSVTDTDGHTWTRIAEHTAAGGGASNGVCASLWGTVATQEIGTADSVNLAVGSAVTAKTVGLMEVTMTASAFAVDGSNQTLDGADGSATTLGSLANVEHLWLNLWGAEGVGTPTAPATDADYTFINAAGTTGGAGATNIRGALVARIFTGTTDTATREGDSSTTEIQILAAISEDTGGAGSVSPAAIARSFTVPAVTVKGSGVAAPSAIARSFTTPAPTVKGSAVTAPSAMTQAFTIPAPTVKGGAVAAPSVISMVVTIPQVTASAGGTPGTVTPAAISRAFAVNAPTVSGAGKASPGVAGTSATPQTVTAKGGAVSSPGTIGRAYTLGQVSVAIPGTVTPAVIVNVTAVPAVTPLGGATVTPSMIAVPASLFASTVKGAGAAAPGTITVAFVIGQVTVLTSLPPTYVEGGMAVVDLAGAISSLIAEGAISVSIIEGSNPTSGGN